MKIKKLCLIAITLVISSSSHSSIDDYYPYKVSPSASNYGNTGILEMPNARMMPEAQLRFNFSSSFPNEFTSLTASPFSRFEATYRYTEIKDIKYGPSSYSGNQSLKDKGFDNILVHPDGILHRKLSLLAFDLHGDAWDPFGYGQQYLARVDIYCEHLEYSILGLSNKLGTYYRQETNNTILIDTISRIELKFIKYRYG